jgi:hypothetical protein
MEWETLPTHLHEDEVFMHAACDILKSQWVNIHY